jgi:hypothetical protein
MPPAPDTTTAAVTVGRRELVRDPRHDDSSDAGLLRAAVLVEGLLLQPGPYSCEQ